MTNEVKFCRDCRYLIPMKLEWQEVKLCALLMFIPILGWTLLGAVLAEHLQNKYKYGCCALSLKRDASLLVDNKPTGENYSRASYMRDDFKPCGTDGKLWEAKP